MDVDNDASVGKAIARVLADKGRIDVLVNNAGISVGGPVEALPLSEFRKAMETNYFGAFGISQQSSPDAGVRSRDHG